MPRPLSLEAEGLDQAIIELRKEPMSCRAVADLLGIPEWRVYVCMQRHRLQGKYRPPKNARRTGDEGQPPAPRRDASLPELITDVRELQRGIAEASGETELKLRRIAHVVCELAERAGVDAQLVELIAKGTR
jgi:hypothetical protein